MADGGKQTAVGCDIAEKQRMVRDHDIGALCTFSRAVGEAEFPEERAFSAEAFVARCRYLVTGQCPEIDLEGIDIIVFALLHIGQDCRELRCLGDFVSRHLSHARAVLG